MTDEILKRIVDLPLIPDNEIATDDYISIWDKSNGITARVNTSALINNTQINIATQSTPGTVAIGTGLIINPSTGQLSLDESYLQDNGQFTSVVQGIKASSPLVLGGDNSTVVNGNYSDFVELSVAPVSYSVGQSSGSSSLGVSKYSYEDFNISSDSIVSIKPKTVLLGDIETVPAKSLLGNISGNTNIVSAIELGKDVAEPYSLSLLLSNGTYQIQDGPEASNTFIKLSRGVTYKISVSTPGHPVFITTQKQVTGNPPNSSYTVGVTNAGATSGFVYIRLSTLTPSTLYIQSGSTATNFIEIRLEDSVPQYSNGLLRSQDGVTSSISTIQYSNTTQTLTLNSTTSSSTDNNLGALVVRGSIGAGSIAVGSTAYISGNLTVNGTASFAPSGIKIISGSLLPSLTTDNSGQVEYNGTNLYIVNSQGVRKTLAYTDSTYDLSATTGNLSVNRGGTGLTSYTRGDLLYSTDTSTISKLAVGSEGRLLKSSSGVPVWDTVDLSSNTNVRNTLAVVNGGTGITTYQAGDILIGKSDGNLQKISGGDVDNRVLISGPTPMWSSISLTTGLITGVLPPNKGGTGYSFYTKGDLLVGNGSFTNKLGVGTDGQMLISDSASSLGVRWGNVPSAGGLTSFTESTSSTTPNGTTTVSTLAASGTASNIDLAFRPKGNGSILASIPDNTSAGGLKRGIFAVDLQMSRSASDQVAVADYSAILSGSNNKIWSFANNSLISGGTGNSVQGYHSTCSGGSSNVISNTGVVVGGGSQNTGAGTYSNISGGIQNYTGGDYSVVSGGFSNHATVEGATIPGGKYAKADVLYKYAYAADRFSQRGDCQYGLLVLKALTSAPDNLSKKLVSGLHTNAPSISNQIVLSNNATYTFSMLVLAKQNATNECKSWEIKGVVQNPTGILGTPIITEIHSSTNATAWAVALSYASGILSIEATSDEVATNSVAWIATCQTAELIN